MARSSAGSWWGRLDRRRANAVVGAGVAAVVVALVLVGLQLHDTQASSRERVVARFHDRAQVVSALTQALLSTATTSASADSVRRYGGASVSDELLTQAARDGHLAYAALLDAQGAVIAGSAASVAGTTKTSTAVKQVLGGAPAALSDVRPATGAGGVATIDLAVALDTPAGRRVLLSGFPTSALSGFLASYLQRVPTRDGTAYVLDSRGQVVGSRHAAEAGRTAADPTLVSALRSRSAGAFGDGQYFTAVPVPGSPWRVVLTSSESSLFVSVSGTRKWLPWVLFAALGVVALGFLVVLRRLLGIAGELSQANRRLHDSNAQLESSNALLRHAAELSRSNAELEQFASIASHDLQEPLRKVQTFAAQLTAREGERLSEEGQDYLRRMSNAAGRMRALIDDLLMFSRVSTKGRPFVPVDLGTTVEQVLIDLEVSVAESGAHVRVAPLPTVDADPVQMRQLMQNLIGNALKFRREGVTPEIEIDAAIRDGICEITIKDNGMGFDPQYASRIFRAFERLHGSGAYPGTGIGLALCRKIMERHHGTIAADGEAEHGSTFTVTMPVTQPQDAEPASTGLFPDTRSDEVPHALA